MTEEKTVIKKPTGKRCIALKALCTAKGRMIKKGDSFVCTMEEYELFRQSKAV